MRVTLQFHPDWPFGGARVIEALAADGVYRSQFETGTSNGGLTAHPGGDRWRWESRIFGGRYDGAPPGQRPRYGALDRHQDPYGGAVRFGSAHLRLGAEVLERTTFCYPDSASEPTAIGGPERVAELCALADEALARGGVDHLDDYVEAHVHGEVRPARDAEAVVLDPCFRDGPVHRAASDLGCPVEWHPGLRVATAGLDPDYRGREHVALAQALGEQLDPSVVGDAARSGDHDPQALKRVWHLLARFGRTTPGEVPR